MAEATIRSLGKYEILQEIGKGGFATVYRARDTTLDREVALKVLHPQLLVNPSFVQRFQREARSLASLRHPHIVTVFEVGEAEGRLFIAMELARGPSLAQAIADRGRIPWNETLALLKPVCEALDYAHGQGVIHRDLKPANILMDEGRGPMLTDFGFARLVGESSASLSLSGGILGTPAYIAPEVWELDAAEVPADVYALGCIVYEMLTGEVLFAGQTPMQVMRAHDRGPELPEAWPEGVPDEIESVLERSLVRDSKARFLRASALWHALNSLETRPQVGTEIDEQAALAAQWRTEMDAAMKTEEWGVAKMALDRLLAIVPEDAAAKQVQAQIERHLQSDRGPVQPPPAALRYVPTSSRQPGASASRPSGMPSPSLTEKRSFPRTWQGGLAWWGLWVLATMAGYAPSGLLIEAALRDPITDWHGTQMIVGSTIFGFAIGAVAGLIAGIAQWLLLRKKLERSGAWILATAIGWAIGLALAWGVVCMVFGPPLSVTIGVVGAATGFSQWIVLRRQMRWAGWWVVGIFLASLAWVAIGVGIRISGVDLLLSIIAFGIVQSVVSGFLLSWLMTRSVSA